MKEQNRTEQNRTEQNRTVQNSTGTYESLEKIPCAICGNEKLINISKKGHFGLPCYVSICPHDGLVFLSPRWYK